MKKVISIFLLMLLLLGAFPAVNWEGVTGLFSINQYSYADTVTQYVYGVEINGEAAEGFLWTQGSEYYYSYEATVTQASGNSIIIDGADVLVFEEVQFYASSGSFEMVGNNWRTWTLNSSYGEFFPAMNIRLRGPGDEIIWLYIGVFCDPKMLTSLTVNGETYSFDLRSDGLIYYDADFTVNKLTGNEITITGDSNVTYESHTSSPQDAFTMGETWHTWSLNMEEEGFAYLRIRLAWNGDPIAEVRISVKCINDPGPDDPGGSGGSGGSHNFNVDKEEGINVINQLNKANLSSDTILTPRNTAELNGLSVTSVTSDEINALVAMAEIHRDDLTEIDNEAIIQIMDQTPEGNHSYEVNMKADDIKTITGSSIDILAINTPISQFRIRSEELRRIDTGSEDRLQFNLTRINHEGRPGIDAILVLGDKVITEFEGAYILEIRIPYKAKAGEDMAALCIEYISEDGSIQLVRESRYDREKEMLSFFPVHLSKYGVAYRPILFSDVASNHWANGYITFLAARDVITNPPGTMFRPDDAITRGEFINMAARAFSVSNLGRRTFQSYEDVPADAWYALAVGWSYTNNISPVLASSGRFYPERSLSREDMSTLINNVSLSLNLRLKKETTVIGFSDANTISPYARDAVPRMVAFGIVSEGGGGRFLPKNNCTRAEAARSISLLMSKMR